MCMRLFSCHGSDALAAQGLFKRAILQSGAGICPFWKPITPEEALNQATMISKELNCEGPEDVLKCLQSKVWIF